MIVTWGDIRDLLECVDKARLSDPATLSVGGELINFDVLELPIDEIGDDRLVAFPVSEIGEIE